MPLRICELTELDFGPGDGLRAEHALSTKLFGLGEGGLNIRDLDVERDVARVVGGRATADAAANADPVGVRVAFSADAPVSQRVVGVDLPAEELGVRRSAVTGRTLPPVIAC